LTHLEAFTPEECAAVIDQVNAFGDQCLQRYGTRLFYCSDEFYIRAGRPLPEEEFYEDYSQIQNGVGMLTSMRSEFDFELDYLDELLEGVKLPRTVSVVTGEAAYGHLSSLAKRLEARVEGLTVQVHKIVNYYFGESVTVAGLLTWQDVASQLQGKALGEELLFPSVMLKADEEVFLDDMTPQDLSEALGGIPCRGVSGDGAEFMHALLGID
jgi:NifB/MoaA-like Fe-S oxidoreductase